MTVCADYASDEVTHNIICITNITVALIHLSTLVTTFCIEIYWWYTYVGILVINYEREIFQTADKSMLGHMYFNVILVKMEDLPGSYCEKQWILTTFINSDTINKRHINVFFTLTQFS